MRLPIPCPKPRPAGRLALVGLLVAMVSPALAGQRILFSDRHGRVGVAPDPDTARMGPRFETPDFMVDLLRPSPPAGLQAPRVLEQAARNQESRVQQNRATSLFLESPYQPFPTQGRQSTRSNPFDPSDPSRDRGEAKETDPNAPLLPWEKDRQRQQWLEEQSRKPDSDSDFDSPTDADPDSASAADRGQPQWARDSKGTRSTTSHPLQGLASPDATNLDLGKRMGLSPLARQLVADGLTGLLPQKEQRERQLSDYKKLLSGTPLSESVKGRYSPGANGEPRNQWRASSLPDASPGFATSDGAGLHRAPSSLPGSSRDPNPAANRPGPQRMDPTPSRSRVESFRRPAMLEIPKRPR